MTKAKKKKRMGYYRLMDPRYILKRISADEVEVELDDIFLKAPNTKAIKDAGVKKVDGNCVSYTSLKKIELGKKYRFRAGDPIEFVSRFFYFKTRNTCQN